MMRASTSGMLHTSAADRSHRRGFSIIECLCAAAVVVAASSLLVPMLIAIARVRENADRRDTALRELQNAIEIARADGKTDAAELQAVGTKLVQERLTVRFESPTFETTVESGDTTQLEGQQAVRASIRWLAPNRVAGEVSLICWLPVGKDAP
jgi:type II secretory pathway pseudopilin PulG